MKTVEIKMHYTFLNIFRFTNVYMTRYKYLLLTFLTYFLARYIINLNIFSFKHFSNGNIFSNNILIEILFVLVYSKFVCYIFSLIATEITNKILKNNYLHSFIFENEKIIHIDCNESKEYYYKDFQIVLFPKNYIYFRKKRFQRFFVDIKQLSNDEKENLKKCIKKARK